MAARKPVESSGNEEFTLEFKTSRKTFHVRKADNGVLYHIGTSLSGRPPKPLPPVERIEDDKGKVVFESNDMHPDFLDQLSRWDIEVVEWEGQRRHRLLQYCAENCVQERPPKEWVAARKKYMPGATDIELQFAYVWSYVGETKEMSREFQELVAGMAFATEKGVAEAQEKFPADS